MKILAIDPSSNRTGYAILESIGERVLEAGILKPDRTTDPANDRIRAMVREAQAIIAEQEPSLIVIEDTTGKVGKRHGSGGGAGLAVYGKAIGWFASMCERLRPGRVKLVLENEWTAGVSKARRQLTVSRLFPKMDLSTDTGGDASDAIGVGLYAVRNLLKPGDSA